ncbi:MAG: hypothetical protein R3Y65_05620 [Bacillota bacterium]
MKRNKIIIASILLVVMLFSAAGCENGGQVIEDEPSKYPNINDITPDDPRKGEEQDIDDILKYMEVADMVQDTRDEIDANMSQFEEFYCADSVDYIEGKLIVGLKDIDEEKIQAIRSVVTDDDLIVFANADYTAKEFDDYAKSVPSNEAINEIKEAGVYIREYAYDDALGTLSLWVVDLDEAKEQIIRDIMQDEDMLELVFVKSSASE